VDALARMWGIMPGMSLDLISVDPEDGMPWDFNITEKRDKAEALVAKGSAMLIIGSPMCSAFSQLQSLYCRRRGPEKVENMIRDGVKHLRFCAKLYRIQMEQGLYFIHEHPAQAKSWQDPEIDKLVRDYRVKTVTGNMCMFGMTQEVEGSTGLIKKATIFMTKAIMIAERLNRVCDKTHKHNQLIGGRVKKAQIYPEESCAQMLRGLLDQMGYDGRLKDTAIGCVLAVEEGETGIVFWDELSGEPLDTERVIRARAQGIAEFRKREVYDEVPISQCWERTSKAPIGVRRVDINKGDSTNQENRSRLVAKEIGKDERRSVRGNITARSEENCVFI
jgi:hypothetical protein